MRTVLLVFFFSKVLADTTKYPRDEDIILLNDSYSRIVGGQPARAGQFPYQTAMYLFKSFTSNLASKCGGSLIHKKWIVTAGHCTTGKVRARVYFGAKSLDKPDQNTQMMWVTGSSEIITNPQYDSNTLKNDIGLIRLPNDVRITRFVQTIKMSINSANSYVGQYAVASGYGKTSDTQDTNDLRYVNLEVISIEQCRRSWNVDDSQICVKTDNPPRQTCNGDSGGPLALISNNQLIGITSFGAKSCTAGVPAVFTRLNTQKSFIQRTTRIQF
ncbi:hypothetical protein ACFFRR_007068 [Megaselia abdita]